MKTSIVVPAHHEEKNIGLLINDLLKLKNIWDELIIVHDNGIDDTGKIADEFSRRFNEITVIHRKKGVRGIGSALKEGTERASGDVVIWVMCDRSDDLNTIPRMIDKIEQGYDMVIGSRYMKGGSRGGLPAHKAVLGIVYSSLSRIKFGLKVRDVTNAFRGFKKTVFEDVDLESEDFSISPEFSIKAHLKGYKVGEVPTIYYRRRVGKPKFGLIDMGMKYARSFWSINVQRSS